MSQTGAEVRLDACAGPGRSRGLAIRDGLARLAGKAAAGTVFDQPEPES